MRKMRKSAAVALTAAMAVTSMGVIPAMADETICRPCIYAGHVFQLFIAHILHFSNHKNAVLSTFSNLKMGRFIHFSNLCMWRLSISRETNVTPLFEGSHGIRLLLMPGESA